MKRVSSTTTCTFFRIDTEAFEHSQGGHSPDHMKFPDFSSTGRQRLSTYCLTLWSTVDASR